MGTWGVGIFSNDLSADVRDDYRALIGEGIDGPAATKRLTENWGPLDEDDAPQFWLALAATQSQLGRLEAGVRDRAVAIIDAGADLHRWSEDAPERLSKRRKVLRDLRDRLVGAQPEPRTVRPRRPIRASFASGDIVAYRLEDGRSLLLRVVGHQVSNADTVAVMELVDWLGNDIPSQETVARLPAMDVRDEMQRRNQTPSPGYLVPMIIGPSVRGRLSVVGHFTPPRLPTEVRRRLCIRPNAGIDPHVPYERHLPWDSIPTFALALLGGSSDSD